MTSNDPQMKQRRNSVASGNNLECDNGESSTQSSASTDTDIADRENPNDNLTFEELGTTYCLFRILVTYNPMHVGLRAR